MNRASGVRVLQQQGARSLASGDANKPGLQSWANQNRAAASRDGSEFEWMRAVC